MKMPNRMSLRGVLGLLFILTLRPSTAMEPNPVPTDKGSARTASPASPAAVTRLGTVIYTRNERQALAGTPAADAAPAAGKPPAQSTELRFDGYVKPERGSVVVWINGQSDGHDDARASGQTSVIRDTGREVVLRVNRQHARELKPGQTDARQEFAEGNNVVLHAGDAAPEHRSALPSDVRRNRTLPVR